MSYFTFDESMEHICIEIGVMLCLMAKLGATVGRGGSSTPKGLAVQVPFSPRLCPCARRNGSHWWVNGWMRGLCKVRWGAINSTMWVSFIHFNTLRSGWVLPLPASQCIFPPLFTFLSSLRIGSTVFWRYMHRFSGTKAPKTLGGSDLMRLKIRFLVLFWEQHHLNLLNKAFRILLLLHSVGFQATTLSSLKLWERFSDRLSAWRWCKWQWFWLVFPGNRSRNWTTCKCDTINCK